MSMPAPTAAAADVGDATAALDQLQVSGHAPAASPAAPSASPAGVWEDITDRLRAAASLLRDGQLLHHASFALRESMSALELGDPKMDACMHVPRNVTSVDRALSSGVIVPGAELSLFQELELVDELLACEVTLYSGASPVHTLFTCFYLHRLSLLRDSRPRLYTYLLLTLKSVDLLRSLIISADIHSEEDFYYNMHGVQLGAASIPQNFRNAHSTATAEPSRPTTTTTEADGAQQQQQQQQDANESLYGGLTSEQLLQRFDEEHAKLDARIAELRGAAATGTAASAASPASDAEYGPADPTSSELHLLTLLSSRWSFRSAWYRTNLGLQRPPYSLRRNIDDTQQFQEQMDRAIRSMRASCRGGSEQQDEEARRALEDAYEKEVAELLVAHAAARAKDPLARAPSFPRKLSPHVAPRALSFGFDARLTHCMVQNAPPRTQAVLHRGDALNMLGDWVGQLRVLGGLPHMANAGALELLGWFVSFHRLNPSVIWRSHLWIMATHAPQGGEDPAQDLFKFVDVSPDRVGAPLSPINAMGGPLSAPSPLSSSKILAAPLPAQGHYNTVELMIRSHMSLCPSIESLALPALVLEGGYRRAPASARPVLDAATAPMTYSFFLSRACSPLHNLLRVLLECPAVFRRRTLAPEVTLISDWNILMADARAVDEQEYWSKALLPQHAQVDIPLHTDPRLVQTHSALLYPYNCYTLIMDCILSIQANYLLAGLEDALYSNAKEIQVTLWYMEHLLNLRVQTRNASWRNRGELITLNRKAPTPAAIEAAQMAIRGATSAQAGAALSAAAAKKKGGAGAKLPAKTPLPPSMPSLPPWNIQYAIAEAQQYICRGLIQLIEGIKLLRVPSSATVAGSAPSSVLVSSMGDDVADTWFAHRFADLRMVSDPPPLHLRDYRATLAQFAEASVPAGSRPGDEAHIAAVMAMGQRSLAHAKDELSRASAEIKSAAAAHASSSPLAVHADHVKSLLHVCVSNTMIVFTYKKAIAAAATAGKRLKLTFKWEKQGGLLYTPLHSAKLVPFPVVQLVQV